MSVQTKAAVKEGSVSKKGIPRVSGIPQRSCATREAIGDGRQQAEPRAEEPVPAVVHEVLCSPGEPLGKSTRAVMEPLLRHDFSRVRVHHDAKAAASAQAVNAAAFTVGQELVFGSGSYRPGTAAGNRLIAHELAHAVQQSDATAKERLEMGRQGSAAEMEAEKAAGLFDGQCPEGITAVADLQLARQPAGSTPGPSGTLARVRYYDRSNFDGRFDAEVSTSPRVVTLIMALAFTPVGWSAYEDPSAKLAVFKAEMKRVVEATWSGVYALQSACAGGEEKFAARVRLLTDGANSHATVYFHPDTPGARSGAGGTEHGLPEQSAALQESDVKAKEHRRYFPQPGKKEPKEHIFYQAAAAHEFGHLLGLQHPRCVSGDPRCYGLTVEEAMDVMGSGSFVSRRDYQPFLRIMKVYGKETLPPACNEWRLVEAG